MMRNFSPWAGAWAGAFISAVHVWLAFHCGNSTWITADGALLIVLGVVTVARPIIRLGYRGWLQESQIISGGVCGDGYRMAPEEEKDAVAVQIVGPSLVLLGTLINGYGGLVWDGMLK